MVVGRQSKISYSQAEREDDSTKEAARDEKEDVGVKLVLGLAYITHTPSLRPEGLFLLPIAFHLSCCHP